MSGEHGEDAGAAVEAVAADHQRPVARLIFGEMVEEHSGERIALGAQGGAGEREPIGDEGDAQIVLPQGRGGRPRRPRRGRRRLGGRAAGAQGEGRERRRQVRRSARRLGPGLSRTIASLPRWTRKWPDEDDLHPAKNSRRADVPAEPLRAGGQIVVVAAANVGRDAEAEDDRDQRDQRNDEAAAKLLALDGLGRRRDFARGRNVAEADAVVCAAAMVGVAINATEAVAAISPLKPTSASPFVLEPDLLDFGLYLIGRSEAVYPSKMATRLKTRSAS